MLIGLSRLSAGWMRALCCTLLGVIALSSRARASGPREVTAQLVVDPARPERLVVRYDNFSDGTRRGLLLSDDAGRSWRLLCSDCIHEQSLQAGLSGTPQLLESIKYEVRRMRSVALTRAGALLISTSMGLLEGDAQGCGFHSVAAFREQDITDLALHPAQPGQAFALLGFEGSAQGLWHRSEDGVWQRFGTAAARPAGGRVVYKSIALAKQGDGVRVYQTVWRYDAEGTGSTVLRVSDDAGQTWREHALTSTEDLKLLAVDPTQVERVLGVIRRGNGRESDWAKELDTLMLSEDGGQSFRPFLDVAQLGDVAFGADGALWVSDEGATINEETRAGLFRAAPGLAAPPVQLSKEPHQCVGYDPANQRYYACQGTRVGRMDAQTGALEALVQLETVAQLASCPGIDTKSVCKQQLCREGYCLVTHFPLAPVCNVYDEPICGPRSVGEVPDAAIADAGAPDVSALDGSVLSEDAPEALDEAPDAGQSVDAAEPKAKRDRSGCSVRVGRGEPGREDWGWLGMLAVLMVRRRRGRAALRLEGSVARTSWLTLLSLVFLAAAGCGGDDPPDGDEKVDEHHHDPIDEDDVVPCPETTPEFKLGMIVAGESASMGADTPARISARLVSASPTAPRKFENNWVLEFLDAEGNPLDDIEVTPKEPWMDVHGHGGGYAPDVVARDEPGQLEFDRVNLKMSGPWRLNLLASSARAGMDEIVFHVCVP